MKLVIALVVSLAVIAGGTYWRFFYPPVVKCAQVESVLEEMVRTINQKDAPTISQALSALLAPSAQVNLEVRFFHLIESQQRVVAQAFDRESFVRFVDNILYSLSDYAISSELTHCALSPEGDWAEIILESKPWGDGASMMGGMSVNMRYTAPTRCEGVVDFSHATPVLTRLQCAVELRSVPKPEEANKISANPEALRQMLGR